MTAKVVFATVGTTSFDNLIQNLNKPAVQQALSNLGFNKLLLQIGNGTCIPRKSPDCNIQVEFFRLKDNIKEEIDNADLIISHAGAGSILEALGAGKPLLVVINEDLMGNHQVEVAKKLSEEQYLSYCTCSTLEVTLQMLDISALKPFPKGNSDAFSRYLNSIMGFN